MFTRVKVSFVMILPQGLSSCSLFSHQLSSTCTNLLRFVCLARNRNSAEEFIFPYIGSWDRAPPSGSRLLRVALGFCFFTIAKPLTFYKHSRYRPHLQSVIICWALSWAIGWNNLPLSFWVILCLPPGLLLLFPTAVLSKQLLGEYCSLLVFFFFNWIFFILCYYDQITHCCTNPNAVDVFLRLIPFSCDFTGGRLGRVRFLQLVLPHMCHSEMF